MASNVRFFWSEIVDIEPMKYLKVKQAKRY
jgi:hypothetical protein